MQNDEAGQDPRLYQRVGELTRMLHDTLRELGYDRYLEQAAHSLPDARTRLSYVAQKTGDSAERVLNLVDSTKAEHDRLQDAAAAARADLTADPVAAVASGRMLQFIEQVQAASGRCDTHLTDIMMAQDFHDLTGQVIAKILMLAQRLEENLVTMLLEQAPLELRAIPGDLGGPAVAAGDRADVVTDQRQVDELLATLGF